MMCLSRFNFLLTEWEKSEAKMNEKGKRGLYPQIKTSRYLSSNEKDSGLDKFSFQSRFEKGYHFCRLSQKRLRKKNVSIIPKIRPDVI
ncbi:hypothetical protein CEXT_162261 [Caerostris extrusa]|uniref:Ycf1 n=1 Tax=Caerostris extrusa TaxID=172846 RepID=A0AAV4X3T3_CAEEX|nr:hypothetical protein CEXT_162261 [Caerostris extrusa]